jgi:hypothetical protein
MPASARTTERLSAASAARVAADAEPRLHQSRQRLGFNEDWFGTVLPRGGWICECANDTCLQHIEMTSSEDEAVRQDGARFFVAPRDEHVWPDIEQVIERNDRYWIVEKTGHAQYLTKRADPRSSPAPLSLNRSRPLTRQPHPPGAKSQ